MASQGQQQPARPGRPSRVGKQQTARRTGTAQPIGLKFRGRPSLGGTSAAGRPAGVATKGKRKSSGVQGKSSQSTLQLTLLGFLFSIDWLWISCM